MDLSHCLIESYTLIARIEEECISCFWCALTYIDGLFLCGRQDRAARITAEVDE